jgi:hypothetical protein
VVFEHSSGFERTKKVLGRSLDFFAIEPTLVVFRVKDGRHPVVYRSQARIGGHRDNCITLKPLTVGRILPKLAREVRDRVLFCDSYTLVRWDLARVTSNSEAIHVDE